MATFYTSKSRGNDENDGSFETPFKTIQRGFLSITHDTVLVIEEGVYYESYLNFTGGVNTSPDRWHVRGDGYVVIDAGGDYSIYAAGSNSPEVAWSNIVFKNAAGYFFNGYSEEYWYFNNCAFIRDGYYYQNGFQYICEDIQGRYLNCLTYGLDGIENNGSGSTRWESCVLMGVTRGRDSSDYFNNCASDNADIILTPGAIDATVTAPPFTSAVDEYDLNLTYDKNHANYSAYATGGYGGGMCGVPDKGSHGWATNSSVQGVNVAPYSNPASSDTRGNGAWANYDWYFDPTWEDISITTGVNDSFQFNEGGGNINASIAQGIYTDGASFATAISNAIVASLATDTHTITFEATNRIQWSTSGTALEINCSSYATNDCWDEMGMDSGSDKTGSTAYEGDHILAKGAVAGAEAGAGHAFIDTSAGSISIDYSSTPIATNADAVSPLISSYYPRKIKSISVFADKDGLGEIDTDAGTATRKIMVRGSNVLFSMQDDPGTTALDWTEVELGGVDISGTLDLAFKHWQLRARLRTNATV